MIRKIIADTCRMFLPGKVWMVCLWLLTAVSCSSDLDGTDKVLTGGVKVSIAANSGLQTRTTLPVQDGQHTDGASVTGVQHVTDVYLYIFEQQEAGYVCRKVLDVQWSENVERIEGGKLPVTTAHLDYFIPYEFTVGRHYRLVAVGLDCAENEDEMPDYDGMNSAQTYGLPASIGVGTSLADAVACLQPGRTPDDIMHSEFFAGSIDFVPAQGSTEVGTIQLYRRVAGLQVCLGQIPDAVERVRVLLYNPQNTKVPLLPQQPDDFVTSPYTDGVNPEAGRVLMDIRKENFESDMSGSSTGTVVESMYRCQGTVFLLPMARPDRDLYDYTLMVEFITTGITGIVGESSKVRLIKPWNDTDDLEWENDYDIGTGIIDALDKYLFPVEANHFYCLGTPESPIDCTKVLR